MPDITKSAEVIITGNATSLNSAVRGVTGQLTMLGGAATAVFTKAALDAAKFETSVASVSTMVDTSIVNMDAMGDSIEALAEDYGKAAGGMAEAQYQVLSAGVEAGESVEFLDQSARAAVGGMTSVETAVDGLTTSVNAWGEASGGVAHTADVMFTAVKSGKTTFGELSGSIGKIASQANSMNISMEETYGTLATLTTKGIATAEAVTYLRGVLSSVTKPSAEAKEVADSLGIAYNTTAIEAQGFGNWLVDLRQKTEGNDEALATLVGSSEALQAVLALTSDNGATLNEVMEDMKSSTGEAEKAFVKMADTAEFRMNQSKERIAGSWRDLGEAALPIIEDMSKKTADLAKRFGEIAETEAGSTVVRFGVQASVGALGVGMLGRGISGVSTAVNVLRPALGNFARFLATPWGAALGLATGAVLLIVDAFMEAERAAKRLEEVMDELPPELGGTKGSEKRSSDPMIRGAELHGEIVEGARDDLRGEIKDLEKEKRLLEDTNIAAMAGGAMEVGGRVVGANKRLMERAGGEAAYWRRIERLKEIRAELEGLDAQMRGANEAYEHARQKLDRAKREVALEVKAGESAEARTTTSSGTRMRVTGAVKAPSGSQSGKASDATSRVPTGERIDRAQLEKDMAQKQSEWDAAVASGLVDTDDKGVAGSVSASKRSADEQKVEDWLKSKAAAAAGTPERYAGGIQQVVVIVQGSDGQELAREVVNTDDFANGVDRRIVRVGKVGLLMG